MLRDRDLRQFLRRLAWLGVAIVALVAAGAAGFMITDGMSAWTAFLHALDVVATVGAYPPPDDGDRVLRRRPRRRAAGRP
jgi:voltage-gated potassium channel